jgi:Fe-S-cluster containining protein
VPTLRDALPPLYRALLGEPFDREVPPEAKATCASCAMLPGAAGDHAAPVDGVPRTFRPDTKCCTFHPRLPNYLVGAILGDASAEGAEGRRRMEARVASGVGVAPLWLHPPRPFQLLYDHARGAFGRARGLRCPFYVEEGGGCGIWRHRDAVCATYYCRYAAGEDGRRMWTAVKELVSLVEIQLARFALLELFPEALLQTGAGARRDPGPLGPEDVDGEASPAAQRALWGRWAGREAELYRGCDEVVRGVDAAALERLLGLDGVVARRALAAAVDAATATRPPPVLELAAGATVRFLPDGRVALAAYSELEGLSLPAEAWPLLVRFDGRAPVAEVRARLRRELGADLDDAVLLELWRHRVLVEPRPGAAG